MINYAPCDILKPVSNELGGGGAWWLITNVEEKVYVLISAISPLKATRFCLKCDRCLIRPREAELFISKDFIIILGLCYIMEALHGEVNAFFISHQNGYSSPKLNFYSG